MTAPPDRATQGIVRDVLGAWGTGRQIAPFSQRDPGFGLAEAYRVASDVSRQRAAAGEKPIGRKIGFTNRKVWVDAPMWGYVYDSTVRDCLGPYGEVALAAFAEPRIEPEIVFGLGAAPVAGMSPRDLLGCIDWVAHGFEIVQSIFPGWTFSGADAIAGYGLHGALLIGNRHRIEGRADDWQDALATFEIDLLRDGEVADRGHAANVLDGPVFALARLVDLLADDSVNPSLAAGEIVTTGTLTAAISIAAGEEWSTRLHGIPLEGLRVRFR